MNGLLDLYNKEKQKNKKLELETIPFLKGELRVYKVYSKQEDLGDFELFMKQNYISKDKIRERYEQLKHYDYIEIKELLKLLEE